MNEIYYKDEVLNRDTTHCCIRPGCKREALGYISHPFLIGRREVSQNLNSKLHLLITVTWDLFQMRMCIFGK